MHALLPACCGMYKPGWLVVCTEHADAAAAACCTCSHCVDPHSQPLLMRRQLTHRQCALSCIPTSSSRPETCLLSVSTTQPLASHSPTHSLRLSYLCGLYHVYACACCCNKQVPCRELSPPAVAPPTACQLSCSGAGHRQRGGIHIRQATHRQ